MKGSDGGGVLHQALGFLCFDVVQEEFSGVQSAHHDLLAWQALHRHLLHGDRVIFHLDFLEHEQPKVKVFDDVKAAGGIKLEQQAGAIAAQHHVALPILTPFHQHHFHSLTLLFEDSVLSIPPDFFLFPPSRRSLRVRLAEQLRRGFPVEVHLGLQWLFYLLLFIVWAVHSRFIRQVMEQVRGCFCLLSGVFVAKDEVDPFMQVFADFCWLQVLSVSFNEIKTISKNIITRSCTHLAARHGSLFSLLTVVLRNCAPRDW